MPIMKKLLCLYLEKEIKIMKKNMIKKIMVTILMVIILLFSYELTVSLLKLLIDYMERNTMIIISVFVTIKLLDKYYLKDKIKNFIKKIFK